MDKPQTDFRNLSLDKAEKILVQSEAQLKSTLDVRAELDKKTAYFLGYCFVWISGLCSVIFFNSSTLGWLILPVLIYLVGLSLIAIRLITVLRPINYQLFGNLSENLTSNQARIDQEYQMFLLGIAQETDDRCKFNMDSNKTKAAALSDSLEKLIQLSILCLLLILVTVLAKSMHWGWFWLNGLNRFWLLRR